MPKEIRQLLDKYIKIQLEYNGNPDWVPIDNLYDYYKHSDGQPPSVTLICSQDGLINEDGTWHTDLTDSGLLSCGVTEKRLEILVNKIGAIFIHELIFGDKAAPRK